MKSKTVITGGLLLFVLASVVTLVLKETRTGEARTATKANVVGPGLGGKIDCLLLARQGPLRHL